MTQINLDTYLRTSRNPFLKGSELKTKTTKVEILNVREANLPHSGMTLIIDVKYKGQERSIALNVTNLRRLVELYGKDCTKWIGKVITLSKVNVINPKTRQEVESIRIK
ncbi:MAG: hypothetical protein QXO15_10400 [Nitrososphaerota archaeon]